MWFKNNIISMKKIVCIFLFLTSFYSFSQETKALFIKEIKTPISMQYILDIPQNMKEKLPLIVFLHGSGERGTDLDLVKNHSPFTYKNLIKEPVALLAPQCPAEVWWDTNAVYQLILEISSKYSIDKSRIYLTGLSMGGWGSWRLAEEHHELFASLAPVCAPIDRNIIVNAKKLSKIPIQIYHGALDDVVTPENSIEIFKELKKLNANVNLTIFSNDNHNSWDSTYSNPDFYTWLLSHKK
jgi:predicted peptidase